MEVVQKVFIKRNELTIYANQGLNPLLGSHGNALISHGLHPWLLLFNPFGIEECPKDINNNSPPVKTGQAVRSSGLMIIGKETTPKWVER
jgi:hypothetical protein